MYTYGKVNSRNVSLVPFPFVRFIFLWYGAGQECFCYKQQKKPPGADGTSTRSNLKIRLPGMAAN